MVDINIFTVGARIEILHIPQRDQVGSDGDIKQPMSPVAEIAIVRFRHRTKNGMRVHFKIEGAKHGYRIDVEKTNAHTFRLLPIED